MSALTDTEIEMLDFASGWWKYAGAKDEEIRQRFDVPAIRYYQQLNALIDRPEAMAARPQVVKRLRRIRARRRARTGATYPPGATAR